MTTTLAAWYFVAWFGHPLAYIGPMSADRCEQIAAIASEFGRCRHANALTACAVGGRPGSYTTCPVFDPEPTVTIKAREPKENGR